MRIITGEARGKKLAALQGDDVRPTTDRVKESLFNILQFRVEGRAFLDLFAGSGQIGLEALSRGAKNAVFVDDSKRSVDIIQKNIEATGLQSRANVVRADYAAYLAANSECFDVVFIDPPYRSGLLGKALEAVSGHVSPKGIIICEHPNDEEVPESAGLFMKQKSYRYGKILLTAYEQQSE